MQCTKAIIPVAGWGTRRLPVTKTIEKCMLPLGNRPVVDYAVQDCIAAGIRDIYFVVSEQSTQIRDFYRSNVDLNNYLRRNGKADLLPLIAPPKVNLHYMVQSSYGKYGTAIPVSLVVPQLDPGEPVVVLMGDDCVYNADGISEVARLIEAAGEDRSAILGVHMPPDQLSHYGVLDVADDGRLRGVVEKPAPGEAPSEMINVSKYVLSHDLLQRIAAHADRDDVAGEYYITDPFNDYLAAGGHMAVVPTKGHYLDTGTLETWVAANNWLLEHQG